MTSFQRSKDKEIFLELRFSVKTVFFYIELLASSNVVPTKIEIMYEALCTRRIIVYVVNSTVGTVTLKIDCELVTNSVFDAELDKLTVCLIIS